MSGEMAAGGIGGIIKPQGPDIAAAAAAIKLAKPAAPIPMPGGGGGRKVGRGSCPPTTPAGSGKASGDSAAALAKKMLPAGAGGGGTPSALPGTVATESQLSQEDGLPPGPMPPAASGITKDPSGASGGAGGRKNDAAGGTRFDGGTKLGGDIMPLPKPPPLPPGGTRPAGLAEKGGRMTQPPPPLTHPLEPFMAPTRQPKPRPTHPPKAVGRARDRGCG
mmetsp:Transcript_54833/g.157682  ORF Transcript_54833/g.157682 Transcript_54833/m.157682 type:complete len:220 (-) Transcript_54833:26-685(-)